MCESVKSMRKLRVISRALCTGVSGGTKVALMAIRAPISSAMREEVAFQRSKHGSVLPHWIHMSANGRSPQGGKEHHQLVFQNSFMASKKVLHALWID